MFQLYKINGEKKKVIFPVSHLRNLMIICTALRVESAPSLPAHACWSLRKTCAAGQL